LLLGGAMCFTFSRISRPRWSASRRWSPRSWRRPRRFFLVIRRFNCLRTSWRSQLTKPVGIDDPQRETVASSEPICCRDGARSTIGARDAHFIRRVDRECAHRAMEWTDGGVRGFAFRRRGLVFIAERLPTARVQRRCGGETAAALHQFSSADRNRSCLEWWRRDALS